MRILQVVHGFPPQDWAGTELVTFHLSQALRDRGHEVTVLARTYEESSPQGTIHESLFEGVPVARIVNNDAFSPIFQLSYDNPFVNRPVLQWLKRKQLDVVHIQHLQHLSVSLLRMIPALGYPTVLNLHDFFFPCHRVHLLDAQQRLCPGPDRGERCVSCLQEITSAQEARRRFTDMERALHAPDVVLSPSRFLTDKISGYFPFLAGRMRTVPHGVPAISGVTRERALRVPGFPLRILYVGVLAPHKGAHVLIEALKGLPREAVEVSLYGLEWSQWHTYIEQLHENAKELPVKFCGPYTHDQLGDIVMQHDVLVMPMIWEETFSILTREAFLAGLPVVAARRGALIEAVRDNLDGLHFEPENPADLRRCLERVLTEPDLLHQLRSAAPPVKTMAEYASEIETIYEEVCKQRLRRRQVEQSSAVISSSSPPSREGTAGTAYKVSVCIPTYNGAAFLAEAITSVLAQSYPHFELLIVDDGSTDETMEIARSFADPRITIYQNEKRLGIPTNWNRCLSLAQGEYLCIFHQDDVMMPENLLRKVAILDAEPTVTFVHSAVEILVEDHAPPVTTEWIEQATKDFTMSGHRYFRKLLHEGNLICAPSVVGRRQPLLEMGGFDEDLGYTSDYEMWLKLCVKGRVAFLSQSLMRYRWHGGNASHQYRFDRGVEELQLAGQRALQYSKETLGPREEHEFLAEALAALGRVRHWGATLEQGKDWWERQAQEWQQIAQERETVMQEQRTWITELEKGKQWLEEQRGNWQHAAETCEKSVQEQRAWIAELEKARHWLEEQRHWGQAEAERWQAEAERWQAEAERWQAEAERWQAEAERRQTEAQRCQEQWWMRLGMRLGAVKAPSGFSAPQREQNE